MTVITRFAPSPTGYLHIGSARTALFNYLFAKHNNGKFLLRIEDTDKERSTKEATEAIFNSLKWLDINWDGEVVFQAQRHERHKQAALELLATGNAYYCFTAQEEIDRQRAAAIENKEHFIFKSKWRDADPSTYPANIQPVVRLKAPNEGSTIIRDQVQGDVVVENSHLDDMVLLRSDGSATYMLAVVIDDHDMGVTHIIRGDDHLTNAARQILLYQAFGWQVPVMAHIPLIHGPDGAKLSKRHGALGVEAYGDMGYLPEALCNYLLRLGWSHGDDEIISREQAIEWFDLAGLGKAPARLDFAKMHNVNAHYLRQMGDDVLTNMVVDFLETNKLIDSSITENDRSCIMQAMHSIKPRVEVVNDMARLAKIYLREQPVEYTEEAQEIISKCNKELIQQVVSTLTNLEPFNKDTVQAELKIIAAANKIKIGELMQPLRAFVTGMANSPSVFEVIAIIGKDASIRRLQLYP